MTERQLVPRYGQPDFGYLAHIAATSPEHDGPVFMVNLMKYRDVADYADGGHSNRSGREADDEYAPTQILRDIGAQIVFVADVERQLIGALPVWDRVAVVKYATRTSFAAMQARSDFQEKHVHKEAGMEQTIVLACVPMPLPEFPVGPDGDDPFVMLHVLKFADGGPARMAEYGATAGAEGLALGVRPEAFLAVEGTVVGDGREWDQVRFNRFPSHAVFDQLRANATHRGGQRVRQSALADSYTLMLKPSVDTMLAAARS